MDKQTIIKELSLEPHIEGGYFKRTYQSEQQVNHRYLMTSIFYLLTDDSPIGYFHMNKSNIMHYFHLGSPITYFTISPESQLETFTLGSDLNSGQCLQKVVKGGYWKAALLKQGAFGLISEAVSPGFDYTDMTLGTPSLLQSIFPQHWSRIKSLVKQD